MPQLIKIKVKRKRNLAHILGVFLILSGIFLVVWGYVGDTYDFTDYSNTNDEYGFTSGSSYFYGTDHKIGGAVGVLLIVIGLLIRFRKRVTAKVKTFFLKNIKKNKTI